MNAPAIVPTENLMTLISQAETALTNAKTAAEVLEAREYARAAYDASKAAARMAKAKQAHDTIMQEAHRTSAKALAMRARAEMRLADEYDAAQERGEVATRQNNPGSGHVGGHNMPPATAAEIGLRRDEIHEARKLRDAEQADPGIIERTVNSMVERGEEPTRAALRREVIEKPKPQKVMNPKALWIWGRLKDFERDGILASDPADLLGEMTEPMRADVRRLLPVVREFIEEMEVQA